MPYPCCCNQTPTGDPICLEGDPIAPADLIAYVNITWNSGAIGGTAPNTYPCAVTTAFSVPAGVALGPAANEADLPCYFDATFGDYYGPGYSWWELPFDSYADYNSVWCSKASAPSFGDQPLYWRYYIVDYICDARIVLRARQGSGTSWVFGYLDISAVDLRTGVDYVLDKTVPAGSVGTIGQTPSWVQNYLAQASVRFGYPLTPYSAKAGTDVYGKSGLEYGK